MGVFSSFLSVVQENAAISAELLGRAGEAEEMEAEGSLPCKKPAWDWDPKNSALQQGPTAARAVGSRQTLTGTARVRDDYFRGPTVAHLSSFLELANLGQKVAVKSDMLPNVEKQM